MTRRLFGGIAALFCVGLLVPSAAACINDRESIKSEKEFKSRYIEQQPPNTTTPPTCCPRSGSLSVP